MGTRERAEALRGLLDQVAEIMTVASAEGVTLGFQIGRDGDEKPFRVTSLTVTEDLAKKAAGS